MSKIKEPITWYSAPGGDVHTVPVGREGTTVVFRVPGHELRVSILNDGKTMLHTLHRIPGKKATKK